MKATIYHNPRCSKSRKTLALMRENGVEPQIVEYLKTPPDEATLASLVAALGIEAAALVRTGEAAYAESGLADADADERQILAAIARHPSLLQRPVVVTDAGARIGRPPEAVLEILPPARTG